jgi:hypothetical protein
MLSIAEIPYREFEMLGMSKKDVLSFPPRTLVALLSGNRTSLIRFKNVSIGTSDNRVTLDGKLSLRKSSDEKLHLNFHPVNNSPKNAFGLDPTELAFLENNGGTFIDKQLRVADGTLKDVKIYLDKIINEYIAINCETIKVPEQINDTVLSEKQQEDFRDGKPVKVQDQDYRLNPNSEIGISHANGEDQNIFAVRFKHSSYSSSELLIDLSLLAYGLDSFVMIEHLSTLLPLQGRTKQENLNDPNYWEAIQQASQTIKLLQEDLKYKPSVIKETIFKQIGELSGRPSIHKVRI